MVLQKHYRKQPERTIATYDYTDIAAGTGVVNYYGLVGKDDSSLTYHLSQSSSYGSWLVETERAAAGTTTLTFDSGEFNLPRTVKGTAYFSGNMFHKSAQTTNVSAQLQKWDGTTSGAITSKITSGDIVGGVGEQMVYLELPATQTQIKKGEQLRLIVKLTTNDTNAALIGHSPTNQTSPTEAAAFTYTRMILGVPFNLDL